MTLPLPALMAPEPVPTRGADPYPWERHPELCGEPIPCAVVERGGVIAEGLHPEEAARVAARVRRVFKDGGGLKQGPARKWVVVWPEHMETR